MSYIEEIEEEAKKHERVTVELKQIGWLNSCKPVRGNLAVKCRKRVFISLLAKVFPIMF